jgi:hypothetical protein
MFIFFNEKFILASSHDAPSTSLRVQFSRDSHCVEAPHFQLVCVRSATRISRLRQTTQTHAGNRRHAYRRLRKAHLLTTDNSPVASPAVKSFKAEQFEMPRPT